MTAKWSRNNMVAASQVRAQQSQRNMAPKNHPLKNHPSGKVGEFEKLRQERDRYLAFSFCGADLLLQIDADFNITFARGAVRSLTGLDNETILHKSIYHIISAEDTLLCRELLVRMTKSGGIEDGLIRVSHQNGAMKHMVLTGYYLKEIFDGFFLTFRRPDQLSLMFEVDGEVNEETGLLEKDSFFQLAEKHIHHLNENNQGQYRLSTLALENLDEMEAHLNPEQLQTWKASLGATLKANAAGNRLVGDLGDNQYALIHKKDVTIEDVSSRLVDISQKLDPSGIGVLVNAAKISATLGSLSGDDATHALIHAVKQLGQNSGSIKNLDSISSDLSNLVEDTAKRMAEARRVIDDKSFQIVFQPVVRLKDRKPHHYEALTRLDDKDANASPYDFIRLAEDVGLVMDFDMAITRQALSFLESGSEIRSDLPIAVNLSGRSLSSDRFLSQFQDLLKDYPRTVRQKLMIEITETVKPSDFEIARKFIHDLRRKGHQVCLDDFGVGEMHIDYLREMNVDYVKIDGSYIKQACHDPTNRTLLKAITGLCKELKIATIAEMVEDQSLEPLLKNLGVILAQGWLYSKPLTEPNMRLIDPKKLKAPAASSAGAAKSKIKANEQKW